MSNFWVIVGHTAEKRLKSKAFLWSTIIISAIVIALMNIGTIVDIFSGDDKTTEKSTVAVVTGEGIEELSEMLVSYNEGEFNYVHYTDGDLESAKQAAENNEFDYVLGLRGDILNLEAEFFGAGTDFMIAQHVRTDVQRMKETVVTNELGLNQEELAMIYNPIYFSELPLTENGEVRTEESHMQSYWMVYALVFAIYMIIILFGSMIATEVATEKSSRVMELIVSSVNPVTQMFGKIIGIGISGLVNILLIVVAAFVGYTISGADYLDTILRDVVDLSLLGYALILIVLGYLLYGGVAAMLGALVSRAEEVNQALQPLIFLAMIAFFVSMFGLNVPDTTFIHVLSYIPFFTPQLLFLRMGMTTVPTWEIIVIISILIISVILINMLAARIYKGGVIMYGKFSFKEGMKQALRLGKKEK
ncbi:ABC transporter permease [Anaerobacillus isosaccharinicus]|uniref:ABC transporter permease n=1 Tax=Anaerobacillus isosaccharinicus TaxID=1532552 RepID=A0A1S2L758_9BACI|nr:ABC transporter permease [Anaerobacillus isosaccharinicus]MBA5586361.1 ABC transporter permease [Anaerobacillus isosaccharinicus]QOY35393.1 ABC transporter permease [Anaerobacillus isosaccharinicus]